MVEERRGPEQEDPNILKYRKLRAKMEEDTRYSSNLNDRFEHPAFAEIVGMGHAAVPIILKEMQQDPDVSFTMFALFPITGEDPTVPPEQIGGFMAIDMSAIKHSWLAWGEEHGHIQPLLESGQE
jgi:hypothetical protein